MKQLFWLAAMTLTLLISACGSGQDAAESPSTTTESPLINAEPAAANAADRAFANGVLAQLPQVEQLTQLARDHSDSPELIALAEAISMAQTQESRTVRVLLVQWTDGAEGAQTPDDGPGLIEPSVVERLGSLQGQEFDTLWLQTMLKHHEGVMVMAQSELKDGANQDAKTLAQTALENRQAEVDQLQNMLGGE